MVDSAADVLEPVLAPSARIVGVALGVLALVTGAVAVFRTDNELGSAALVTAGVAIVGLAMFGNRIHAFEAAGLRLELVRQAKEASQRAEEARASGEIDRADELEVRAQRLLVAASAVGSQYEALRTTEPSGWDRTSRMEDVLRDARAIDTEGLGAPHVEGIFDTGRDGNRVFALALIERNPRLGSAHVLVEALVHSRSSFEQYHALVAAENALDDLPADDRARVREAVESVLAGRLGEKSSDRRTIARRILQRLTPTQDD
jgi:hypothetical protein